MTSFTESDRERAIRGALLGTAVGDALGLPFEGISPRRIRSLRAVPLRHRLAFGRGMVSDDTEHACMVAQSLIAAGSNEVRFVKELARRLRWWFAALPAGVGLATLKSCIRLWLGLSPSKSGVYSAGNGPAMRSVMIGASVDDPARMLRLVQRSTRMTHTDPKAYAGAAAIALAAHLAAREPVSVQAFQRHFHDLGPREPELDELISRACSHVASHDTSAFALILGLHRGVTGYMYHTVPVCLHAWLRHKADYAGGVNAVVSCGGDTDSTAAVVGGLIGTSVGENGIPGDWLAGIVEWPRSIAWMQDLARQLAHANGQVTRPPALWFPAVVARNLFFIMIVLAHGLRRGLPPY